MDIREFFDITVLDNRMYDYAVVAGVILFSFFLRKLAGTYVTRLLFFIFRHMGWKVDHEVFTRLILGPTVGFLFLLIAYISLSGLTFPDTLRHAFLKTDTQRVVQSFAISFVLLSFFRMLLRSIDYIAIEMEKRANLTSDLSDNQLVLFFKDFLKVVFMIIGFLAILRFAFNQDITKILAGLSLIGAAIALAARESLENLIASFIIFFDKPFMTGDLLKVGNITGTVERIGLRSTRIRTPEKTYVTMPNKQMVDSVVDNLTRRSQRRAEMKLDIDLRTGSAKLQDLVDGIHRILESPMVMQKSVYMSDITADSYLIQCEYFTELISIEEFSILKQDVNLKVIRLLEDLDVSIAGAEKAVKLRRPL
jgi:MscS family membrane protein